LVIRFGRLGDTVLLQPLLHALHRRYGTPCTLLARGSWPSSLYRGHDDIASVISLADTHRPFLFDPQRWGIILRLRRRVPGPVYVCEPEPRALAKIKHMLALAGIKREDCVFISATPQALDEHWIERLMRFATSTPASFDGRSSGPLDTPDNGAPTLQLDHADRVDCDAWLSSLGPGGAPVLLQPSNKRTVRWNGTRGPDDDKWWPTERWTELALRVHEHRPEARVLLCGAPREADYLQSICNEVRAPWIHVVANELPLRRLMALTERAHSMISVDTGPAHVAAAFGCPLVVLFGRVSPRQWLPRSPSGSAVHALGGPSEGGRVDALSIDDVLASWRDLPDAPNRDRISLPEHVS
jgi:heptosyltransferase-2/heptosyltransferase-3